MRASVRALHPRAVIVEVDAEVDGREPLPSQPANCRQDAQPVLTARHQGGRGGEGGSQAPTYKERLQNSVIMGMMMMMMMMLVMMRRRRRRMWIIMRMLAIII